MKGLSPKFPLKFNNVLGAYQNNLTFREVIRQNFKNLLLTSPGERMMIPDFGCGIRRYLFEFEEDASFEDLTAIIEDQVEAYMPFIQIDDIAIDNVVLGGKESSHTMAFTITYSVPSLGFKDSLLITS